MSKRKWKFITMFYNCRSEEPKSWDHGHKIIEGLNKNNIEYQLDYPEDEHYECTVSALRPSNMPVKEFNQLIKSL